MEWAGAESNREPASADPQRTDGDGTMRTSKFTPEQMVHILRQGDSGVPVVELCRQHGISGIQFAHAGSRCVAACDGTSRIV
jgi:hypothetical protein